MNNIIALIKQYKCNNFNEIKDVINFTDNINNYSFNEYELYNIHYNRFTKYLKIINIKTNNHILISNRQLDIIKNRIL